MYVYCLVQWTVHCSSSIYACNWNSCSHEQSSVTLHFNTVQPLSKAGMRHRYIRQFMCLEKETHFQCKQIEFVSREHVPNDNKAVMSCADEHTWVPWVCLNNKHLITVLLQGPAAPPPLTLQQHVSHSAEQDQEHHTYSLYCTWPYCSYVHMWSKWKLQVRVAVVDYWTHKFTQKRCYDCILNCPSSSLVTR